MRTARLLPRLGALALAGGLAVLGACSPSGSSIAPQYLPAAASALDALKGLPDTVAHEGVRRIRTQRALPNGGTSVAEHRETVRVASNADFQVECTEVLVSPLADPAEYVNRQNRREGFQHRYRDFRIRDVGLLLSNYLVVDFGQPLQVAGRSCFVIRLERRDDPRTSEPIVGWQLAVDEETGLVLRWRRTLDGAVTDEGVYESIAYGEPARMVPHLPTNQEAPIATPDDARRLLDFAPVTPTLLPDGFQRVERAGVVDGSGRPWLKETFTDGVEVAFFLYREEPAPPPSPLLQKQVGRGGIAAPSQATRVQGGAAVGTGVFPQQPLPQSGPDTSSLTFVESGDVSIGEYTDGRRTAIVAGRLDADDLQWMIESAVF